MVYMIFENSGMKRESGEIVVSPEYFAAISYSKIYIYIF